MVEKHYEMNMRCLLLVVLDIGTYNPEYPLLLEFHISESVDRLIQLM